MKISSDLTRVHVSIDQELSARELESFISDLAEIRAQLTPPVPMDKPTKDDDVRVSVQERPTLIGIPLKDGRIRLWLRNHGLGWLCFNLSTDQATTLRDFLVKNTQAAPTGPLFAGDVDGRHGTH